MGQALSRIEKMYDRVARDYSQQFSREHEKKPQDRQMLRRFSRELEGKKPVFDLGCGPGHTTKYLHNLGLEISGLDLSSKMVAQAQENYAGINFCQGNILDLDFDNGSIAGIIAFYAIVHLTEEQVAAAFVEILRILKPGGLFLFTYHIGHETIHLSEFLGKKIDIEFMFFTTEFILSCLKKTGFEKIEIIEREPYPQVEYQSRRAYVLTGKPI